jgi:hypothetical protein
VTYTTHTAIACTRVAEGPFLHVRAVTRRGQRRQPYGSATPRTNEEGQ